MCQILLYSLLLDMCLHSNAQMPGSMPNPSNLPFLHNVQIKKDHNGHAHIFPIDIIHTAGVYRSGVRGNICDR